MKHFYRDVKGWFNFEKIYSQTVKLAKDGFHFVEVGAWLGCSTAYMIVEIVNSKKNIQFDVVDTWLGSPDETWAYKDVLEQNNGCAYDVFVKNMGDAIQHVNPIKMESTQAAALYDDESLDFIFIDSCHAYQSVKCDLKAWYPKLKKGGCIAGHDYGLSGVSAAVNEFFGAKNIKTVDNSWVYMPLLTVYTLTYNEEYMLPHFINHYRSRFPKCHIVVCDNHSTDDTVAIAKANDCTVCYYNSNDTMRDDYLVFIKDGIWRYPQGIWRSNHVCQSKWCAIVDCDEFIDTTFSVLDNANFNIVRAVGYEMWGEDGDLDKICCGAFSPLESKVCLWKPGEISSINFAPGAHSANPIPYDGYEVKFNENSINLLHYKYISLDYVRDKHKFYTNRLSEINKEQKWSGHYLHSPDCTYWQIHKNMVKLVNKEVVNLL
jgi:predicted O-methyltransferase YrrM